MNRIHVYVIIQMMHVMNIAVVIQHVQVRQLHYGILIENASTIVQSISDNSSLFLSIYHTSL
jgi:hypothetical protein